jgi:hypothetical protein
MTMSLTLCRNGTVGHPCADGSQLLLGPFLWFSVGPCGALRLDVSPHAPSSVLWQVSLWPLL